MARSQDEVVFVASPSRSDLILRSGPKDRVSKDDGERRAINAQVTAVGASASMSVTTSMITGRLAASA